jgi:hypothetical protein
VRVLCPAAMGREHGMTSMNMRERFAPLEVVATNARAPRVPSWVLLVGATLTAWAKNWADHWAAAAAYDDLSRLSDTQLKQRRLSRDILARDL